MSDYRLKTPAGLDKAIETYEKIRDGVVDTYEKIEDTVTGTYQKIEDKFVDAFLDSDKKNADEPVFEDVDGEPADKASSRKEQIFETYEKIRDGVTGAYEIIEDTVVGTYQKIEDKFVDTFLEKVDNPVQNVDNSDKPSTENVNEPAEEQN